MDKRLTIRNIGEEDDLCNAVTYEDVTGKNRLQYVWFNIYWYIVLHSLALYGLKLLFSVSIPTLIFFFFMYTISGLGITAGAHRLWSHRSYQAKMPLQILLMFFNTAAAQNSALEWCRDHRVHHKFSETHADPHNAKRGFFFAHMGWLMVRKHSDVREKGKGVSMTDLERNPILTFQERYYLPLVFIIGLLFPTFIPWLCWGESVLVGFFVPGVLRYVLVLHATWLVNSLAHLVGNKPYDRKINPAESLPVCIFAIGEGFHNYHHTFPYDYSTSEFGITFNPTTLFINCMAWIGWAYDLKKVSPQAIAGRKARTGDGTPHIFYPFPVNKPTILPELGNKSNKPEHESSNGFARKLENGKFEAANGTALPLLKPEKEAVDQGYLQRRTNYAANDEAHVQSLDQANTNPDSSGVVSTKTAQKSEMQGNIVRPQPEEPEIQSSKEEPLLTLEQRGSATHDGSLQVRTFSGGDEESVEHQGGMGPAVTSNTVEKCGGEHINTAVASLSSAGVPCQPNESESPGGGGGNKVGQTFLSKDLMDQTGSLRQRIFSHTNLLNVGDF